MTILIFEALELNSMPLGMNIHGYRYGFNH